VTVCAANEHDKLQVADVLDGIVVPRPEGMQHICLDKGYDYDDTRAEIEARGYVAHIPARGLSTPVLSAWRPEPASRQKMGGRALPCLATQVP